MFCLGCIYGFIGLLLGKRPKKAYNLNMHKILVGIFVLGLLLRVIGIGSHPAGFTPDEASFGYDAYSLLKTGNDQWGNSWPLILKSFGDGKMPVYSYLLMPFIAILGLSEWVVRLPNALIGSLAIIATYWMVKTWRHNETEAMLSAFLLAISPWHIMMSRGAFEANLTTFLMPLGIYLFLFGLIKEKYLLVSSIIFGINLFTYHSARYVTPLLIMGLVALNRKLIVKHHTLRNFSLSFGLFFIVAALTYLYGAGARLNSSSIFSLASNVGVDRYSAVLVGLPDFIARAFHNKLSFMIKLFIDNYLSYFSPQFLFMNGPGEFSYGMIPGKGVLYFIEAFGLFGFIKGILNHKIKGYGIIIYWILVGLIPAALSIGPGYAANRAVIVLPGLTILIAMGFTYFFSNLRSQNKKVILPFITLFLLIEAVFYLENYLYIQPAYGAHAMSYGAKEVFYEIKRLEDNFDEVIITKNISEAHIFAAFYLKINPTEYQQSAQMWKFEDEGLSWVDQLGNYNLGKYVFKEVQLKTDVKSRTLVVAPYQENLDLNIIKIIRFPNQQEAYMLIDGNSVDFAYIK